jgi:hypothetical protein
MARMHRVLGAALAAAGCAIAAAPAYATYPGENGEILFATRAPNFSRNDALRQVNPDGSGLRPVTSDTGEFFGGGSPSWAPDGSSFVWNTDEEFGGLARFDVATGHVTRIFGQSESDPGPYVPSVALDGSLAFRWHGLEVSAADGSGRHTLRPDADRAVYSPDGTTIAFAQSNGTEWVTYEMNVDGSNQRQVSPHGQNVFPIDWSPDGSKLLVFAGFGADLELREMPASGGVAQPVGLLNAKDAAYSPDGTKLVLNIVNHVDENAAPTSDLYITDRAGNVLRQLTDTPERTEYEPAWQPLPKAAPPTGGGGTGAGSEPAGQPEVTVNLGGPNCSAIDGKRLTLNARAGKWLVIKPSGVIGSDGKAAGWTLDGATQDERVRGRGDTTGPDAKRLSGGRVKVRAERNGHGNGRVYRVRFVARASDGKKCAAAVYVGVPKKRGHRAIDSGSRRFDSLKRG